MADQITEWLSRLRDGDRESLDRLIPLLYGELRGVAHQWLRRERQGHTLSTTALVNEAYLKLLKQDRVRVEDRMEFIAVAANTMRRILVDYARAKKRIKRGGGQRDVPLEEVEPYLSEQEADEVLALDEALDRLAASSPRAAQVVQYRFYGGLTLEESAELLETSTKTVQRDWLAARAWLRKEIAADLGD